MLSRKAEERLADITEQVIEKLKSTYRFKKEENGWLRQGVCPSCNAKELYVKLDSPWVVRCGRLNKCGWEGRTKQLFPEAFEKFNDRYVATPEEPNATADAYLRISRGFDLERIKGWYTQGAWWHPDADRGTATVRFSYGPAELGLYMERFVEAVTVTDPKTGEKERRRARFHGNYQGYWWEPPGLEINDGDEIWIAEGCIKAIALNLAGKKAVANLSAYNYPEKSAEPHKEKSVTWVWAQDNDQAGRSFTRKFTERMREEGFAGDVTAAQVPLSRGKVDWDDLHLTGALTERDLHEYLYQGQLLLAKTAGDKGLLIYKREGLQSFPFEFRNRLYWFEVDVAAFHKKMREMASEEEFKHMSEEERKEKAMLNSKSMVEIADCYPRALYYQRNAVTDEAWYYFRVTFPHAGPAAKGAFTAAQVTSAGEFTKRLAHVAPGAMFTGSQSHLQRLMKKQLYNIKVVETVDYVGYSKDHSCYVFNKIAVKEGKVTALNDEDFFDIGKLAIKTLNQSTALNLTTDRDKFRTDWVKKLVACYGRKGIIALAWWLGALFAEQIREAHKSYPFVEIIGEPGAGKTTLIEFLWKLLGRPAHEGFDPSKASPAARSRNFAQVSNLPVVLIESDRDEENTAKSRRFDFDELKTAYNGRPIRSIGVKNAGTDTYEPPFRGAVCIAQNAAVQASDAIHERLIHLRFTKAEHSLATKDIAMELAQTPVEDVSHFLIHALRHEAQVMNIVRGRHDHYEKRLLSLDGMKHFRIALNHAQLMSLVEALGTLIPLGDDIVKATHKEIEQAALERQQAIAADHPMVEEFWETYEFIESGEGRKLNHSANPGIIGINLNEFIDLASHFRQQVPDIRDLKRHLKTSRTRKFLGQDAIFSRIKSTAGKAATARCWLFENPDKTEDRP